MIYRYFEGRHKDRPGLYLANRPILGFVFVVKLWGAHYVYFRFRWGWPQGHPNQHTMIWDIE